jgi:activating signal cointegrator 1
MKAISLLQPWATLVGLGVKQYEVRGWQTPYRGGLLIHASAKKWSRRQKKFFEEAPYFNRYIEDMDHLPYGCIIAKVVLTHIYKTEQLVQHPETDPFLNWSQELAFDDYSPNRFAWRVEEAQMLLHFLPVKGVLGLWEYNGTL